ncbi:hypothetical protein [Hymenobacter bucti]|uniref:Uncharacterized protein n=1 Tax=Hymenobacter bucti TaxID=1844114 RepID=A0ABW4QTN6_9BACT
MLHSYQPIIKDQALPPALDYAALRAEGLACLQRLSGQTWTDYNDHDPGVTLLEALCFALTDVGYRAALPVPTLLAPAAPGPPAAGLLVPAHHAFANHPVTPNDYKKLLLDQFPGQLRNAWVSVLAAPAAPGHYEVVLARRSPLPGEDVVADGALAAQVLGFLNRHRNLGELFGRATVLQPRPVVVGGHLELAAGHQPTPVLAQLLLALGQALAPAVPTTTVAELLAQGHTPDELFAGPRAHYLLLAENFFAPRPTNLEVGALLRQVEQVPGVYLLHELHFITPGANSQRPAQVARLTLGPTELGELAAADTLQQLRVSQHGLPLAFDPARVLRAYGKLRSTANRVLLARPDQLRLPPLPAAPYAALGQYDSVQRLLPVLYGVGEEGPPPQAPAPDRAYIMQLKGYLLLFDQLLADFCAQLEHVGDFFSARPQPATYYPGSLYEVPYVAPLLPGTGISPDESWQRDPAAEDRWQAYKDQPANAYRQSLPRIAAATTHDAPDRRHRFLAHLLARFGYTAQLHRPATQGHRPATDPDPTNAAYEQLLHHLNRATYHRAAARLPATTEAGATAESGLELFLFLLTGLVPLPRKAAAPASAEREAEDEYFSLLDHLVLKPTAELPAPAAAAELPDTEAAAPAPGPTKTAPDDNADADHADFYHYQATVLLPAEAGRFQPEAAGAGAPRVADSQAFLEELIRQHAPAYMLVNIRWLGGPAMREWEALYAALAAASGLLNASGEDQAALPAAQAAAHHFLQRLARLAAPA